MIDPRSALYRRRKAVSSVLASVLMFVMIFGVGIGAFVFVNNTALQTSQARAIQQQGLLQQGQEKPALLAPTSLAVDAGTSGDLWLRVVNQGSVPITITAVYVSNSQGQVASKSTVGTHPPFLTGNPDLNVTLPLTINPASSTQTMSGCASTTGCDIGISTAAYSYTSGTVALSILTSAGNEFSALYPIPQTTTATQTTVTSSTTTTTTGTAVAGGNALVVTMAASPPQVYSGATVTDTVTVYNYAYSAVTNVVLAPTPPTATVTGTASLTAANCSPASFASIPAYSGSGTASSVVFTCTYTSATGAVGGFAFFSGEAEGTLSGATVDSAEAISNTIQIGGTVNALNQGPFSPNFFFFGYSSCTNAPSGGQYSSACTTSPSTMPPASIYTLPTGDYLSGHDYYVAFYVQITNEFNTTLPILTYSYFQTDPGQGGESDFFLVGAATSPQTTYYPNYAVSHGLPQLTAYTANAVTCAETAPNYSPPPATTCIDVAPAQTVTLTFAACAPGSSSWDWGGRTDGTSFDSGASCGNQSPPDYVPPESTWLGIIISFIYKGQVFFQGIPFEGQTVTP